MMAPEPATRVLAVDLGATSVRVAAVDLAAEHPHVEVLHRWCHGPVRHDDGSVRWDWDGIVGAVEAGLDAALAAGPAASIGVDGWAVDTALVDADGGLLTAPFSYRDDRTAGWEGVADRIGRDELHRRTGIQLMPINTIFQLAAHEPEELARAAGIVLLPDLLVHHLTGHLGSERSNASTTGLLDARTGDWDDDLLAVVGVRRGQLPPVEGAGQRVGTHRGVPVHTVGSHDTASAFLGLPGKPGPGTAVVASGTWVLVGTERDDPDLSDAARNANLSNEGGALGGVRLLKNVLGFWLLERCRDAWGGPPIDELLAEADDADDLGDAPVVGLGASDLAAADDVEAAFRHVAGLEQAPRGMVVRSVVASIVQAAVDALRDVEEVTGDRLTEVLHVGGATRMERCNRLLARRSGLPVRVGSPEAAALGNALVQGLALGYFNDERGAREWAGRAATVVPPGHDRVAG